MSDVFLSYAEEDREHAAAVARALQERGWSVWWDRDIRPGTEFDETIQKELDGCRCVVVLWSPRSTGSRWVRAEAEEGANRGILVPATIEPTSIPLGFRRLQSASLLDWDGSSSGAGLNPLVARIAEVLEKPPAPVPAGSPGWMAPVLVMGPTVLLLGVLGALMSCHVPSRIELELSVDRVQCTLATGPQVVSILRGIPVSSLGVERFEGITLHPSELRLADDDSLPSRTGRWVPAAQRVTLRPMASRLDPGVTMEAGGCAQSVGVTNRLDAVRSEPPAIVTLESRRGRSSGFTLRLDGGKPRALLTTPGCAILFANHVVVEEDRELLASNGSGVLQVLLKPDRPVIEMSSGKSLILSIDPKPGVRTLRSSSEDAIPLTAIEFADLNETGSRISTIRGGRIAYLDEPRRTVSVSPHQFLALSQLCNFRLHEVGLEPTQGLHLRMTGIAGRLSSGEAGEVEDLRQTAFDRLRRSRAWSALAILAWAVSTIAGSRRWLRARRRER